MVHYVTNALVDGKGVLLIACVEPLVIEHIHEPSGRVERRLPWSPLRTRLVLGRRPLLLMAIVTFMIVLVFLGGPRALELLEERIGEHLLVERIVHRPPTITLERCAAW